jgi:hypothetical protein
LQPKNVYSYLAVGTRRMMPRARQNRILEPRGDHAVEVNQHGWPSAPGSGKKKPVGAGITGIIDHRIRGLEDPGRLEGAAVVKGQG